MSVACFQTVKQIKKMKGFSCSCLIPTHRSQKVRPWLSKASFQPKRRNFTGYSVSFRVSNCCSRLRSFGNSFALSNRIFSVLKLQFNGGAKFKLKKRAGKGRQSLNEATMLDWTASIMSWRWFCFSFVLLFFKCHTIFFFFL